MFGKKKTGKTQWSMKKKCSSTKSQNVTLQCRFLVIQHRQASSSIWPLLGWPEQNRTGLSLAQWRRNKIRAALTAVWQQMLTFSSQSPQQPNKVLTKRVGLIFLFLFFILVAIFTPPSSSQSTDGFNCFQARRTSDMNPIWHVCTRTTGMQGKLRSGLHLTFLKKCYDAFLMDVCLF